MQFFRLDVLYECPDGTLAVAPSSHIIQQLHNIIKMSSDPADSPVGVLTTEHRDTWTKSRERIIMGEWSYVLMYTLSLCIFWGGLSSFPTFSQSLITTSSIPRLPDFQCIEINQGAWAQPITHWETLTRLFNLAKFGELGKGHIWMHACMLVTLSFQTTKLNFHR